MRRRPQRVLEQADPVFAQIDMVLILGANDLANTSARRSGPTGPFYAFGFVLGAGILFGVGAGGGCPRR